MGYIDHRSLVSSINKALKRAVMGTPPFFMVENLNLIFCKNAVIDSNVINYPVQIVDRRFPFPAYTHTTRRLSYAIALGHRLEPYGLLFYEDPVSSLNMEAIARVSDAVDIPIAVGESYPNILALRPLIEREIIDVAQPDTGRFGGLLQMKKLAAIAEAHHIMLAPHDGSLGPVAEMAAVHFLATIPNFLIQEHLANDVRQRYEVMRGQPDIVDGHIIVPDTPGLGVDIDEEVIARHPPASNCIPMDEHPEHGYQYVAARMKRARWLGD